MAAATERILATGLRTTKTKNARLSEAGFWRARLRRNGVSGPVGFLISLSVLVRGVQWAGSWAWYGQAFLA